MPAGSRIEIQRFGAKFAQLAAVATFLSALAAMLSWAIGAATLENFGLGTASTRPNTAFALMLCGLSLRTLSGASVLDTRRKRIGQASALLVLTLALLTMVEYTSNANLGIDTLLFHDAVIATGNAHPGRMSFNTALCLLLASTALLSLDVETRRGRPAEWLVLVAMAFCYVGLLGYLYGAASLVRVDAYSVKSLQTIVTLLVLSAGILFARTHSGLVGLVMSKSAGGDPGAATARLADPAG